MVLLLIFYGIIIYGICLALHTFSDYLDFEAPAKAEKKYKKTLKAKYNLDGSEPNKLINIKTKNMDELHKKAIAYVEYVLENTNTSKLTATEKTKLFKNCYQYYIDKYKFTFS